jgi:sterol 3beta-glucosyltransferase
MRITILTIGSRGDVQPLIALGARLHRAGHEVRIATHGQFQNLTTEQGLEFFPVAGDITEMIRLQSLEGKDTIGLFHSLRRLAEFMTPLAERLWSDTWNAAVAMLTTAGGWFNIAERLWNDAWNACRGTDAIIYGFFASFLGHYAAEKLGVPCFATSMCPTFGPTRAFPNLAFPALPLGGGYNYLTHVAFDRCTWQTVRLVHHCARRKNPNLPPLTGWPYDRLNGRPVPILYAYSSAVSPKPPDWDEWQHVTGYWFLDRPSNWQPPDDLVGFLDSGPPPVYIGFSSVSQLSLEVTAIVLEALARTGQRGLLQPGWGGLGNTDLPDEVFKIESVPHDWLFPRMAAVVHHGGAGTTADGLRAGIPSILIPFNSDQPYWGRRVAELGVGPKPIPRRRLSVERLAAAIIAATNDHDMQRRATALGQRIRAENGAAKAVEIVFRHLSTH